MNKIIYNSIVDDLYVLQLKQEFVMLEFRDLKLLLNKKSKYFSTTFLGKLIDQNKMKRYFKTIFTDKFMKTVNHYENELITSGILESIDILKNAEFHPKTKLIYIQRNTGKISSYSNMFVGYYFHLSLLPEFINWFSREKLIIYSSTIKDIFSYMEEIFSDLEKYSFDDNE